MKRAAVVGAIIAGLSLGACGSDDDGVAPPAAPTAEQIAKEERFLAAVKRTSGRSVAKDYRDFFRCVDNAGVKNPVPEPPRKRIKFQVSLYGQTDQLEGVKECDRFVKAARPIRSK